MDGLLLPPLISPPALFCLMPLLVLPAAAAARLAAVVPAPLAAKPGVEPAVLKIRRCVNFPAGVEVRERTLRSVGVGTVLPMLNPTAGAANEANAAGVPAAVAVVADAWWGEANEAVPPIRTDFEALPSPIRTRFFTGNPAPPAPAPCSCCTGTSNFFSKFNLPNLLPLLLMPSLVYPSLTLLSQPLPSAGVRLTLLMALPLIPSNDDLLRLLAQREGVTLCMNRPNIPLLLALGLLLLLLPPS